MRPVKAPNASNLDVPGALSAICATGRGRCWHCDRKLPAVEAAIDAGWDVQRMEGKHVASIILVCPKCRHKRGEVGEKRFVSHLSRPICDTVQ